MSLLRCCSSLGCPDRSLDETLALAERHHLAAVELRTLGGSMDLPAYFASKFQTPERLARHLRGSPVRIVALNTSLRLIGGTPAEREELVAVVEWAEALGIRWLRVFDGGRDANAAELAEAAATLGWWSSLRRERQWRVEVMVETHDSLLTTPALDRFRTACPGVALLWDSHHTWRKGGEDPLATWRSLRPAVVHVHVKDSVGRPSARHPFTYVLPGDGEFPSRPLIAALQADRFEGPVSLEWEKQWHPYLPPLEDALRAAERCGWW